MNNDPYVALVTGATSGLGRALVERLVNNGWKVYGIARNETQLSQLELKYKDFHAIKCDLEDSRSYSEALTQLRGAKIDLLINNAAFFKYESIEDIDISDVLKMVNINLVGPILLVKLLLENIKNSTLKRIVNINSVAGLNGIKDQSVYCATKFGLKGFSEAVAQEVIQHGVLITNVHPGGINTPLWNDDNPYPGDVCDLLEVEDVVNLVEHVASLPARVVLKEITVFPRSEWH